MRFFEKKIAWLVDQLLCLLISFLTGVRPKAANSLKFSPEKKVYFANHSSHGDFLLLWISLPRRWRMRVRPVAGADYWLNSKVKRFVIKNVFNALLIERDGASPRLGLEQMSAALQNGESLIVFPEGTRNTNDDTLLLPFKSGIYHLARANSDVRFVPMWINNINHVLPKGTLLPVPLLCDVHIGEEMTRQEQESRTCFLQRLSHALLELAPFEKQLKNKPCNNQE